MTFRHILERAERRKGGADALQSLLPVDVAQDGLRNVTDDRALATMARVIFNSGFNWKVIDRKWPGFEEAFKGFDIDTLVSAPPEMLDDLASDTRIVRNGIKIKAVFDNAQFVKSIADEHGSVGNWLADWPKGDQVSLMLELKKKAKRLGGNSGQYFLRFIGYDGFVLSQDVIYALRDSGLEINPNPTSKRDLTAIQNRFNEWQSETGLSYVHLSRIAAMSIGEDYFKADEDTLDDEAALRALGDIPQ